jgi:hypothetical protein
MENPFKSWTQKDWLYAGGAVASVIALVWFAMSQKQTAIPSGVVTDAQNLQTPAAGSNAPNYVNYNTYDVADVIPRASGSDVAPDVSNTSGSGCGCDRAGNSYCAQASPLSTGNTYSSVDALISYYQNTNPTYVELQKVQLQRYAALFATGETYAQGGQDLGVKGIVS